MQILFKKLNNNIDLPKYQTKHSAGVDLQAAIDKPITLKPLQRHLIPCGFAIALPDGYEAQIRARSGLALKHGIAMTNGIGTIDADYRGEIGAIIINLGNEEFTIKPGDRIAQMVIAKYQKASFKEVISLEETDRGTGGFGSTGK